MNILPLQRDSDVAVKYARFFGKGTEKGVDISEWRKPDVYFYHSDLCGSRAQSQVRLSYAEMEQSVRSKHLGSASWITDRAGNAVQHLQYLPYGEPYINQRLSGYSERFTFSDEGNAGGFPNSKAQRECFAERYGFSAANATVRDEETGYGYFGARYMDHELMTMWLSVDPMADKYPSISPYAYCAWTRPTGGDEHRWIKYNTVNNPVKLVDPDGMDVWPTSEDAYQTILLTIPEEARAYVQRDIAGAIDKDLINSFDCESTNFRDLKDLVNNDCIVEVTISSSINYRCKDGSIGTNYDFGLYPLNIDISEANTAWNAAGTLSTGESGFTGFTGFTQYPISSSQLSSVNDNVVVYLNSQLSTQGRSEVLSHELYGHAYVFILTGDLGAATHDYDGTRDRNIPLYNRIINAKRETMTYGNQ